MLDTEEVHQVAEAECEKVWYTQVQCSKCMKLVAYFGHNFIPTMTIRVSRQVTVDMCFSLTDETKVEETKGFHLRGG